jgi:S-adenosylmethionine decarboxylase
MNATRLVGGRSVCPVSVETAGKGPPELPNGSTKKILPDHFIDQDGIQFAGSHLIIDFWGSRYLNDLPLMERTLRECVERAGATLLHIHLHRFPSSGGISGVAVLAESHISVHTWPERAFAAFDIFMCGGTMPEEALKVLKRVFVPQAVNIIEKRRGIVSNEDSL